MNTRTRSTYVHVEANIKIRFTFNIWSIDNVGDVHAAPDELTLENQTSV